MKFLIAIVLCTTSTIGFTQERSLRVKCAAPISVTEVVRHNAQTYQSTYKLFDGQWEEIDTESAHETIPEHLQSTNAQLQSYVEKTCKN